MEHAEKSVVDQSKGVVAWYLVTGEVLRAPKLYDSVCGISPTVYV